MAKRPKTYFLNCVRCGAKFTHPIVIIDGGVLYGIGCPACGQKSSAIKIRPVRICSKPTNKWEKYVVLGAFLVLYTIILYYFWR
jgi:DNA-directed RNA polymerase subunit RPC12/RpoP